jgi:hypothetical protein
LLQYFMRWKPHIYLRLNLFFDTTTQVMSHVYTWRRILTQYKLTGFWEKKLNYISFYINMIGGDYLEVQELRQKMLQTVFSLIFHEGFSSVIRRL